MKIGHPLTTSELHPALTVTKDELVENMRQMETNLVTEFHRYAKGQQSQ